MAKRCDVPFTLFQSMLGLFWGWCVKEWICWQLFLLILNVGLALVADKAVIHRRQQISKRIPSKWKEKPQKMQSKHLLQKLCLNAKRKFLKAKAHCFFPLLLFSSSPFNLPVAIVLPQVYLASIYSAPSPTTLP
ncbi:hypothetical protein EYC80_005245 [Monilinia laxa]|uniref:Uncharacterized protein n=1 Tax=Monilinia laxa TaxID=61186 RepID=A0A5N6KJL3_MONLA|nr:hypothetical protein EYC80_005245 [Monilinia laxa]